MKTHTPHTQKANTYTLVIFPKLVHIYVREQLSPPHFRRPLVRAMRGGRSRPKSEPGTFAADLIMQLIKETGGIGSSRVTLLPLNATVPRVLHTYTLTTDPFPRITINDSNTTSKLGLFEFIRHVPKWATRSSERLKRHIHEFRPLSQHYQPVPRSAPRSKLDITPTNVVAPPGVDLTGVTPRSINYLRRMRGRGPG